MKFKDIVAICRRQKYVVLYSDEESAEQYIGDGSSVYKLEGLPWLTMDNLLKIIDVPEKDRGKWFAVEKPLPKDICLADCCEERAITDMGRYPNIEFLGYSLIPLKTSIGVVMLQKEYLKPMGNSLYMRLFERRADSGIVYIAVKDGLDFKAALFPVMLPKEFECIMAELADGIAKRYAIFNISEHCAGISINQDTGEVEDGDGE